MPVFPRPPFPPRLASLVILLALAPGCTPRAGANLGEEALNAALAQGADAPLVRLEHRSPEAPELAWSVILRRTEPARNRAEVPRWSLEKAPASPGGPPAPTVALAERAANLMSATRELKLRVIGDTAATEAEAFRPRWIWEPGELRLEFADPLPRAAFIRARATLGARSAWVEARGRLPALLQAHAEGWDRLADRRWLTRPADDFDRIELRQPARPTVVALRHGLRWEIAGGTRGKASLPPPRLAGASSPASAFLAAELLAETPLLEALPRAPSCANRAWTLALTGRRAVPTSLSACRAGNELIATSSDRPGEWFKVGLRRSASP